MKNHWQDYFPAYSNLQKKGELYLDSASTSLKPAIVSKLINRYWTEETSNVGRAEYASAEKNTLLFEDVRSKISNFVGAEEGSTIFTHGTTHSINFVMQMLGRGKERLRVLTTPIEHHSNLLPWLKSAEVTFLELNEFGVVDWKKFASLDLGKFDLLTLNHVSNITGNINPIRGCCELARAAGLLTLIDGAQAVGHTVTNLQEIGCDFYAFSGHKMFAPSGVGCLVVSDQSFFKQEPISWGGGMVNYVDADKIELVQGTQRFESGTPAIEAVLGLGGAVEFIEQIGGIREIESALKQLNNYAIERFSTIGHLQPIVKVDPENHQPIFTFNFKDPKVDAKVLVRTLIDSYGLNINFGYQCCQFYYRQCNLPQGLRLSFHIYNSPADVDRAYEALKALSVFF